MRRAQLVPPRPRAPDARRSRSRPSGLAGSVLALQRSAGNAAVVRMLARDPERDPWEESQPPKFPRGSGDPPGMTGCSIVHKKDGWYVKCEHESGRSTPDIPTGPKEVGDTIPKEERKTPPGPLRNPDQAPWLRRPPSLDDICASNPKAPVCLDLNAGGPPPWFGAPSGEFYSSEIHFEHNLPTGAQGGMTSDGARELEWVVGHLQADPTLQARLVGHASSEGTAKENQQLSVRRAKAIYGALAAKGLGARVQDLVDGPEPAGCTRVEFGIWACGASRAAAGEVRPEDRKVVVTFLRN
jgi:hypothetical protein